MKTKKTKRIFLPINETGVSS